MVEAVSCKGVTKQSNNSQFRKGLKEVGNRFICEVLGWVKKVLKREMYRIRSGVHESAWWKLYPARW